MLDLDVLLPEPKEIKLCGRVMDFNPPTLRMLIGITRLEEELAAVKSPEEIMEKIVTVLSPMIPGIKDIPDFDISLGQLRALIEFARDNSLEVSDTAKDYSPKKKGN